MLTERHRAVVPTDYHQFLIEPAESVPLPSGVHPETNLAVFGGQTLRVNVGTRVGPVNLELELHDSPPAYDDSAWEDVAEGDLSYDNVGGLVVWGMEYGGFEQAIPSAAGRTLTPPGAHRYRVRIYARGKAIDYDGVHSEALEDYLIQLWPAAEAEPALQMKNLSGR